MFGNICFIYEKGYGQFIVKKEKCVWNFKWNNTEGTISGNGKDNEGKKIKFKVGSS